MMELARHHLKQVAVTALGSQLVVKRKLQEISRHQALTILNLHRVDANSGSAYESLQPKLFDELVGWLRTQFHLTTFRELDRQRTFKKPPLILSFDDGYRDFIDVVVPILKKHGVSANQNIIPGCVDSGQPPMNVLVQDFIGTAPASLLREITFPGLAGGVDPDNRVRSGILASAALKRRPLAEQKEVFSVLESQFKRFDQFCPTPMMTVDQIRQVCGTYEIGAHSFNHATMTAETDDYLVEDAVRCRDWFVARLGMRSAVYAFPNGMARDGQADLVRSVGFPVVLLVGEGFSRCDTWRHQRFTFYAKSSAEARFRAVGGFATPTALGRPIA